MAMYSFIGIVIIIATMTTILTTLTITITGFAAGSVTISSIECNIMLRQDPRPERNNPEKVSYCRTADEINPALP